MKHFYLIPLAGRGQRFLDAGYDLPKQMLSCAGSTCWEWTVSSLNLEDSQVVFIIREESDLLFHLGAFLRDTTPARCQVLTINEHTRGSLETCLHATSSIPADSALTIFTGDVMFRPTYDPRPFIDRASPLDGWLTTFKSNSPEYSYLALDEGGNPVRTAEKLVISDQAIVGIYGFGSLAEFQTLAEEELRRPPQFGTEYYLAPVYNRLLAKGGNIFTEEVAENHIFGTPDELHFFDRFSAPTFETKPTVGLCGDHSGYATKQQLAKILRALGCEVIDFGPYVDVDCDYIDFVRPAVRALNLREVDIIFGSCRSGQGVMAAASVFDGVWPALIYDTDAARLAVQHNCANFLSFPSRLWENENQLEGAVVEILNARFLGGRFQGRVMKSESASRDASA